MMISLQHKPAESFRDHQALFTRHVRDPEHEPAPPGVEERRLAVYREALYNNIERMISNYFPVLRGVMAENDWHAMVRDYFRRHRSRVPPLLPVIGREFVSYLENERDSADDPPFILELAHYEWISFALYVDARTIDWRGVDREGNLLAGVPVINPLSYFLSYRFPVHKIGPAFRPVEPPAGQTHIVVYRDADLNVGFMELNAVAARLLSLIRENRHLNGCGLLEVIAHELKHRDPDGVLVHGLEVLQKLRSRGVLLGTRRG